ncbi:formate dehydrogenase accessory sulfurtransferase FdhD [Nocardioides sp. Kera G14]|uniref:formate dehydrogenase accessory sulfurtransferase FdhD n=1 Tax=Nocardioides sp. Kera G14 TaxID=2884264 RepID=UPI001D12CB8E|nr:formate dehydrogenase accessory sulfurtransferase FdhD [Nocardioides sp. Kera G14]UDY23711.1 formate dehydrogenase accessory sulfurtransferase FdhD [Nocardioides sp. Kera G14]
MSRRAVSRRVTRITLDDADRPVVRERPDQLAAEEPLEIRVSGRPLAVTMRTPGNDVELAAGFLVSEGVVRAREDVATARYCAGAVVDDVNTYNVLDVALAPGVTLPDFGLERSVYTSSSCGVCGKASIDAVRTRSSFDVSADAVEVDARLLLGLPDRLREQQALFDKTGGLHAAGLVSASTGEFLVVREDVGRHNAVDKVVGWALEHGLLPLRGHVLVVSGRASFELVQKASMAGIPVLAAVSAPSSLAVELAAEAGVTVAGFVRGRTMSIYSRPGRVLTGSDEKERHLERDQLRPQP